MSNSRNRRGLPHHDDAHTRCIADPAIPRCPPPDLYRAGQFSGFDARSGKYVAFSYLFGEITLYEEPDLGRHRTIDISKICAFSRVYCCKRTNILRRIFIASDSSQRALVDVPQLSIIFRRMRKRVGRFAVLSLQVHCGAAVAKLIFQT